MGYLSFGRKGPGEVELECGISHARIARWLDEELGLVERDGAREFRENGASCLVEVADARPHTLGTVALPRCQLSVTGDPQAIDAFDRLFTLRFMSAGG